MNLESLDPLERALYDALVAMFECDNPEYVWQLVLERIANEKE